VRWGGWGWWRAALGWGGELSLTCGDRSRESRCCVALVPPVVLVGVGAGMLQLFGPAVVSWVAGMEVVWQKVRAGVRMGV